MSRKKVLVTGAAGRIGQIRHLNDHLRFGIPVEDALSHALHLILAAGHQHQPARQQCGRDVRGCQRGGTGEARHLSRVLTRPQ